MKVVVFAITLFTTVALWFQIGAVALTLIPVIGLCFLLAIAPAFVEAMEAELAGATALPSERAGKAHTVSCVDGTACWGVAQLSEQRPRTVEA